jgi:transposase
MQLYRSQEERRRIVEETLRPGASVAVIGRQHGVIANQMFHWRKLYREGRLDRGESLTPLVPGANISFVDRLEQLPIPQ